MTKKMALGRGLGALIEDVSVTQSREERKEAQAAYSPVAEIVVDKIEANPYQPRSTFDEEQLNELAESIRTLGIIQPITVREKDGAYQLISGERRLRASKIAGLQTIPAYVRTANDQGMLELALVENIQREDLDAIEVAVSYQRLIDECNLTHDTLSERVGKKRTTITNYLRLLKLPAEVQLGIRERKLSMGHARALVSLESDPISLLKLYRKVLEQDLSVRKTEDLVRNISERAEKVKEHEQHEESEQLSEIDELKLTLSKVFGWGAQVKAGSNGSGKIVISYRSQGELDEIVSKLNRIGE